MSKFSQTYTFVRTHTAAINLAAFILVAALAVLYIVQINSSVASGYQIRGLELHIHELTIENQQMEIATREVQSLDHITQSMKMLGMVQSGTPQYVASASPSFAMAR